MIGDKERLQAVIEAADKLAEATERLTGEFPRSEWARRWADAERARKHYIDVRNSVKQ